jgi:hypothetical protein
MKSDDPRVVLADLRSGRIPQTELYAAIHALGHGTVSDAKSVVESFLTSDDAQLRYIALNVLTIHWALQEHRQTCEFFLTNDPDSDNRRAGVAGIGALCEHTCDPDALALLLRVFDNAAEEPHVRDAAYSSILYVLGAPVGEQPPLTRLMDLANDVNPERIAEARRIARSVVSRK